MKLKHILSAAMIAAVATVSAQNAPKYIFYYIGDGMGVSPVVTAETYNRDVLKNDKPLLMLQFPVASMCLTYSASSPITDSAAAGTALSTGIKTKNGMLGMAPDTTAVTSVARQLQDMGYGIGVVTSVAPDDATPGAFYANVETRKMYYEIGIQAAHSGYDFLSGAGLRGTVDKQGNPTDLEAVMAEQGVQLVYGPEGIDSISSDKVFLLNPKDTPNYNIGYTIDSIPGVLTLPVITQACLDHLTAHKPDKFFMMVEGGNIDHALHANDGGAAIKEIINFNQALAIAYNFYLAHPDETLIVVTADHDTGGSALVHPSTGGLPRLGLYDYQKVSKEEFSNYCKAVLRSRMIYTWDDMRQYLQENLGFFTHLPVSDEALADLRAKFDATFELRNSADQKTLYANFNAFAVAVFDMLNDAAGVRFTTTSHSGMPVPVFAVGAGAERFASMNNNIDIPAILRELTGVK